MSYVEQKKFFETAYRTGTDIWTNKLYQSKIFGYISRLPENTIVLDLGTGRGRWPFTMAEMGFKVIGIDYIGHLIKINNREVISRNLEGRIRFIEGDVFDINLQNETIDIVTDFGLLQHLVKDDWQKYGSEVNRVLKNGGYVLSVTLSKETKKFYNFSPEDANEADFEKYGVHYHFFTEDELKNVYGHNFKIVNAEVLRLEGESLLIALLRKD
ncbi:MAG: class I SAM-dependent methyltransferase [Bacteroidetes bacterium]|nr:class I SAM-dependent methyltransferase [Bacteroidota bacterium]